MKMKKEINRYVVADLHGNFKALKEVLKKSKFDYDNDELIVLGDICDGYSDSYYIVEELLKIKNLVFVIGNHDAWFMSHMATGWAEHIWLAQGGMATLDSYKCDSYNYKKIPQTHKDFYNKGVYYYEVDDMLFVHGGFHYPKHPNKNDIEVLTWDRTLFDRCKNDMIEIKGWKKVFIGHTSTELEGSEPIIIEPRTKEGATLINIDCGAGWKGRLCLYNIDTDEYFLSKFAKGHDKY